MPNRREFVTQAVLASSGVPLVLASEKDAKTPAKQAKEGGQAAHSLRILVLGGMGNIGPYHVRAALDRGHKVAVFSRGKSSADLPSDVEQLLGDRNGDVESIRNRDWDAVLDLATYVPKWVRMLGQAL